MTHGAALSTPSERSARDDTCPTLTFLPGLVDPATHLGEGLRRIRVDENGRVLDREHPHVAAPLQELARSRIADEAS